MTDQGTAGSVPSREALGQPELAAAFARRPAAGQRVLVIDNYDSFVYNLVQYLGGLGATVEVRRNDAIAIDGLLAMAPDAILLSPGPGHPAVERDFGVCRAVLEDQRVTVPVLGVCLGHQGLGLACGAEVVRAERILHGKTSLVHHDGDPLFTGLPNPFPAGRYHSLVVKADTLPDHLQRIAWTKEDEVMGLRHRHRPFVGVQFHPESILTPGGIAVLENFLAEARSAAKDPTDPSPDPADPAPGEGADRMIDHG